MGEWGESGAEAGHLDRPAGIAVDGDGDVYVVDRSGARVQRFTPDGELLADWVVPAAGLTSTHPIGLAVASDNSLFVTDASQHQVHHLAPTGELIESLGEPGAAPGQLRFPLALTLDDSGRLYVADSGNRRVQVFTPGE
jgi:sugar lactone lactonase YvrE